jgi:hypothetical protein
MKTTSFVTFTLAALSATVLSAPTPQMLTGLLGSITEPSAGNGNLFQGNGINNGNQVLLTYLYPLCYYLTSHLER